MKKIFMAALLAFGILGASFSQESSWIKSEYEVPVAKKGSGADLNPSNNGWAKFKSIVLSNDFVWEGPNEVYSGFEGALRYLMGPGLVEDSNGYGFVFDHQDSDNYYYIKLKIVEGIKGFFTLGKKVNADSIKILPWTECNVIKAEQNEVNLVKVEAKDGKKDIYINGTLVYTIEKPGKNCGHVKYLCQPDSRGSVIYVCKFLKFQTK